MIELGLGANLPAKRGDRRRVHLRLGQHFDRLDAPQQAVLALEHVAHAAVADRVENAVGPERELRPSVAKLLRLPRVEKPQAHEVLAERIVGRVLQRLLRGE